MAEALFRTNMFRVTDEKKYRELCARILGDVEFWEKPSIDGSTVYHGFGGFCLMPVFLELPSENELVQEYCQIEGKTLYTEEGNPVHSVEEADKFVTEKGCKALYLDREQEDLVFALSNLEDSLFELELQQILHPDDNFELVEIAGDLRCITANALLITRNAEIRSVSFNRVIEDALKEMRGEKSHNKKEEF